MVVCIQGSVHQGSSCFSNMSRGRQCAFMSLSALMFSQCLPVQMRTSTNIDQILYYGDLMYVDAFRSNLIPDRETLLIDKLPNVFIGPTIRLAIPTFFKYSCLDALTLNFQMYLEFMKHYNMHYSYQMTLF